jgi:hypothetical protein
MDISIPALASCAGSVSAVVGVSFGDIGALVDR